MANHQFDHEENALVALHYASNDSQSLIQTGMQNVAEYVLLANNDSTSVHSDEDTFHRA